MSKQFQVAMDAHDPKALGAFWIEVLGYVEEGLPPGYATWPEALAGGAFRPSGTTTPTPSSTRRGRPPDFFQKVPEDKTAKNRVHLDVTSAPGDRARPRASAEVLVRAQGLTELVGAGASRRPSRNGWAITSIGPAGPGGQRVRPRRHRGAEHRSALPPLPIPVLRSAAEA